MSVIKLLKAFRVNQNEVRVLYIHNELRYEFMVEWNNIHPSTGEVDDYDLQPTSLSSNEALNERVIEAIQEGESDDNQYLELYLEIRDTFDRMDCVDLA